MPWRELGERTWLLSPGRPTRRLASGGDRMPARIHSGRESSTLTVLCNPVGVALRLVLLSG